jgi:hypothetical protein
MSFTRQGGTEDVPDYIYYNADIINNETDERGNNNSSVVDPVIRFQETRDTALVKDCGDYYFSIVRFSMNGPAKNLPLFVPNIQSGTGQVNPNLTEYGMALAMTGNVGNTSSALLIQAMPAIRWIQWAPQNKSPDSAPTPPGLSASQFKGPYVSTQSYSIGDIVTTDPVYTTTPTNAQTLVNYLYSTYTGSYFIVKQCSPWDANSTYTTGAIVSWNGLNWRATSTPTLGVNPSGSTAWSPNITGIATTNSTVWTSVDEDKGTNQNLSSQYYFAMTYTWFCDLWNLTMYNPADLANAAVTGQYSRAKSTCCMCDLYYAWFDQCLARGITLAGSATFSAFLVTYNLVPPTLFYNPTTKLFELYQANIQSGTRVVADLGTSTTMGVLSGNIFTRLMFNTNMKGLLDNFNYQYFNNPTAGSLTIGYGNNAANVAFTTGGTDSSGYVSLATGTGKPPIGYAYELQTTNKFYTNILDYTGVAYVPDLTLQNAYFPQSFKKYFWKLTQDFNSTGDLWSPISSIVFTSTLLPIKNEAVGQPIILGSGNIGQSQPVSASAFQPIITDVALDLATSGAEGYKQFIYYSPVAEYRLADFSAKNQSIRTIDIQVFWKNRLDGSLNPIRMYNLSSVSIKCMFRRKGVGGKVPQKE